MLRQYYLCFLHVILTSCVHEVHSFSVDESKRAMIQSAVSNQCKSHCKIDKCWSETEDIVFCTIEFSFVPEWTQSEILTNIADELERLGLSTGFCGRDDFATRMVGAFFRGVGGAAVSGVTGGGSGHYYGYSDNHKTSEYPGSRLEEACMSNLREKGKDIQYRR